MSAEVPKLHRRLALGGPGAVGERPPVEVVVTFVDTAPVFSPSPVAPSGEQPLVDDRAMAFPALHHFEYV